MVRVEVGSGWFDADYKIPNLIKITLGIGVGVNRNHSDWTGHLVEISLEKRRAVTTPLIWSKFASNAVCRMHSAGEMAPIFQDFYAAPISCVVFRGFTTTVS